MWTWAIRVRLHANCKLSLEFVVAGERKLGQPHLVEVANFILLLNCMLLRVQQLEWSEPYSVSASKVEYHHNGCEKSKSNTHKDNDSVFTVHSTMFSFICKKKMPV